MTLKINLKKKHQFIEVSRSFKYVLHTEICYSMYRNSFSIKAKQIQVDFHRLNHQLFFCKDHVIYFLKLQSCPVFRFYLLIA